MNDQPSASANGQGFVKLQRSEATQTLLGDPNAMHLLTVIAYRARWTDGESLDGLKFGQALVGDCKACGLSRKEYRCAMQRLARRGLASFESIVREGRRGTLATLLDGRVFALRDERARANRGKVKGQGRGQQVSEANSPDGAIGGANSRANEGPERGQSGATNQKERREERQNTNPGGLDLVATKAAGKPNDFDEWAAYGATLDPAWPVIDLRASFDHYEANGWRQKGGNPIKNWQAACRTCHQRWKGRAPQDSKSGTLSPQYRQF